jgi:L-arabinokinase
MGALMRESHASYGACGLGSDGTDRLVELVRAAGSERGLFGAKITGGGSGGTVAVFGREDAELLVREIAARYEAESGRVAEVFAHSGPGADELGIVKLGGGWGAMGGG